MKLTLTYFSSQGGKILKKLIMTCNLIVVISMLAVINISASVHSENRKISIKADDMQLRDLFREIENNSEYAFFYSEQYSELDRKISMDITEGNINTIMSKLLDNTNLDYQILDNNFVVIKPKTTQQENVVNGKVVDADGNSLPGVKVLIKGTDKGAITDGDGNYSIAISDPAAILVFSSIGFNEEEMAVGAQTVINLTMVEILDELSEVVVIGYGYQRKEAVTGSVGSIGGDEIREVPSSDMTSALQGRVAGVEMMQTNSKPGSTMQIRIRGTRSLNADNDPLIVLDGIPFSGSISDIDPNGIKSIDILKDASATAIYGSRGANGVILISTNKGSKGQKAQLSYNTYFGFKKAIKYPMMNGADFYRLRTLADRFDNGLDEDSTVNTDWQDLFYRDAIFKNHDMKVTGGTENGSYNFGVGYYQDQSPIPSQQFTRYSIRGSIDQAVGKYIKIGFSSNNIYSLTEGDQIGLYGVLSMTPLATPYNADGTLKRTVRMAVDEPFMITRDVIDNLGDTWVSETKAYAAYNNLYGELNIPGIEGLKYRINLGSNIRIEGKGTFTGEGVNSTSATNSSAASITNKYSNGWILENLLSYNRTFAEKHDLNLVALYSTEENQYNKSHVQARDIPNPDFQYYNLGLATGEITVSPGVDIYDPSRERYQNYYKTGLVSWMGRVIYSYDARYMFTAAVRSDGSSRLSEGNKWHTYPALSLGWNIGNETFMDNVTFINLLKIRAGYGQTSNQAVEPYATLGSLATRPYNFGDQYVTGYYVNNLPSNLGWEYSETYNYGLDFSLFKGRLSGAAEYYITNTKDLLLQVSLPPTSGAENVYGNIGKTRNKGVELSLNGKILDNYNGWNWELGFNLYHNKNTLIALASGVEEDVANWWFVGHPINVVYDYEYLGIWQEDEADELELYESGGNVGMIKVRYTGDYNEDGTPVRRIGPDDRIPLSVDPDFQGGFNTYVSYKGIDLSIVGAYKKGGLLISTLHSSSGYLNMLTGRRNNVDVDYWTPENTDARYPYPDGIIESDNPKYGSTLGYFDASYMKIRTITLGYSLDGINWIKKNGLSKLRIYITAQNPFVFFSPFHSETGLDPEANSYGNENAAVSNAYRQRILTIGTNTPSTRNYLVGLNVTF
jgi:TonB-linked SusC/RagA family outer membrane protein